LFVLVVRVHRIPVAIEIDDTPYVAGCKSWVELPFAISTNQACPILADAEFAARRHRTVGFFAGE
jgi:hypothetical protein